MKKLLLVILFGLVGFSTMAFSFFPSDPKYWPDGVCLNGTFECPYPVDVFSGWEIAVADVVRTNLAWSDPESDELFRVLLRTERGEFWVSAKYFDVVEPGQTDWGIHQYDIEWHPKKHKSGLLVSKDLEARLYVFYEKSAKDLAVDEKWEHFSRLALENGWVYNEYLDVMYPFSECYAMSLGMFTQQGWDPTVSKLCWGETTPTESLEYYFGWGMDFWGVLGSALGVVSYPELPSGTKVQEGTISPCSEGALPFFAYVKEFQSTDEGFHCHGWESSLSTTVKIVLEAFDDDTTVFIMNGGYIGLVLLDDRFDWGAYYEWGDVIPPYYPYLIPLNEEIYFFRVISSCE